MRTQEGLGRTAVFGGGNMGLAILRAWAARDPDLSRISVIDPFPTDELTALASNTGLELIKSAPSGGVGSIILAVKPQIFASLAPTLPEALMRGSLVVSIMAGVPLARLRHGLPSARAVVRAMPNIAVSAGEGVVACVPERGMTVEDRAVANRLFSGLGLVEWLADESQMDAITGLAGSGLAYVFHMVECLTQAGVACGLSANISERLARMTVQGSGALLKATGQPAHELRAQVTSPNGTTAAGLAVLLRDGRLQRVMNETVAAAARRSRELS